MFLLVIDSKQTPTVDVMTPDLFKKKLFFQKQNFLLGLNCMDLSSLILMCSGDSLDFLPAVWSLE